MNLAFALTAPIFKGSGSSPGVPCPCHITFYVGLPWKLVKNRTGVEMAGETELPHHIPLKSATTTVAVRTQALTNDSLQLAMQALQSRGSCLPPPTAHP